jgi:protein-disulfide isomerase
MRAMRRTLLLAAAAAALAGCQKIEDEAFGAKVRAYLIEHPEVLIEVQQSLQAKQQAQADDFTRTVVKANRAALERDPRDFVANPDGKITVVQIYDYNCPYCKVAAPEVMTMIRQNPDVRFVFKEYPFQTPASELAARLALGAKAQGKTLALHQALMAAKPLDEASILRSLQTAGVDVEAATAAGESAAVTQHLKDNIALTDKLQIGTPTFFVGDEVIAGWKPDALKAAIVKARKEAPRRSMQAPEASGTPNPARPADAASVPADRPT